MSNFANVRYRLHNLVVLSSNGQGIDIPCAAGNGMVRLGRLETRPGLAKRLRF